MDKALKQRLVGASVIIALAIIVLPMLLSGRPESDSGQSQIMEVPPRPDGLSFETRRFPVTDIGENSRPREHAASTGDTAQNPRPVLPSAKAADSGGNTGAAATSPAATANPTPESAAAAPPGTATEQAAMDSVQGALASTNPADTLSSGVGVEAGVDAGVEAGVEPGDESEGEAGAGAEAEAGDGLVSNTAVQAVTPELEGGGRYIVQVASLSSKENANRLESRLQKQGFSVLRDTVESDVGRLYRVRVGPFAKETKAAEASARIRTELTGVSPRVLDLQPELTAPVTNPNDPLVRWVVQLGVFSDSGNATKLVDQLRSDGLTAYSETISVKSAITHRVRVGPFLEHDEAIRTRQQLAERQNINGVVMTAD